MRSRTSRGRSRAVDFDAGRGRGDTVKSEHTSQAQFVAIARERHPGVVIAAVPNGGLRDKRTAARLKAEGVLAGYPDLIVDEARAPYHGLRIEFKRERGGRVTKAQREVHERLEARGYRVVVAEGLEAGLEALDRYLVLPRWPAGRGGRRVTLSEHRRRMLR